MTQKLKKGVDLCTVMACQKTTVAVRPERFHALVFAPDNGSLELKICHKGE